jgi:hypothetical protein
MLQHLTRDRQFLIQILTSKQVPLRNTGHGKQVLRVKCPLLNSSLEHGPKPDVSISHRKQFFPEISFFLSLPLRVVPVLNL